MIKIRKVGIIGTGHVGSHVAFALATQGEVDELRMADIDKKKAFSQAMDVNDAVSYLPHHVEAIACDVDDFGDCDVVVFSAGPLPTLSQSRLDTLQDTVDVMKEVIPRLKKSGFQGIIVSISNPADVVAAYLQKHLNFDKKRILSTGTALDSSRLQRLLSEHFRVNRRSLTAYSMGEHGGSAMIPWSQIRIAGKPITELIEENPARYPDFDREQMLKDMKRGGYVVLEGKGSTEFGIASSCVEIIRAIFHNEHKVLPASVLLDGGIYGQQGVFASVPVMLGSEGIEEIIEVHMAPEEEAAFAETCRVICEYTEKAEHM